MSDGADDPGLSGGFGPGRDPKTGRILPGHNLGTRKPKGARSRLSDAFFQDLAEVWEAQGMQAMIATASNEPATFVRVVASLMPKQVQEVAEDHLAALSEEDVDAVIKLAREQRAKEEQGA